MAGLQGVGGPTHLSFEQKFLQQPFRPGGPKPGFGEFGPLFQKPMRPRDWHSGPQPMQRFQKPEPIRYRKPVYRGPIPGPGQKIGRFGKTFLRGFGILGGLFTAYELLQPFLPAHGYGDGYYNFAGWNAYCDVGYGPNKFPVYIKTGSLAPNIPCSQAALDVPSGAYGDPIPAGSRWVSIGQDNSIGPVDRMGRNQQWTHFPTPIPVPLEFTPPIYGPLPWVPPEAPPEKTPLPRIPPFGAPPWDPPPTDFGPPHAQRPPRKDEAEQKKRVSYTAFVKFGRALANGISEADDFLDALFQSMPRWAQFNQGVKPGHPTFNQFTGKATAVYRYIRSGKADGNFVQKAVYNVIDNEVKDRIAGRIGRKGREIVRKNPYWTSPVGLQAGGRYRQNYVGG